MPLTFRRSYIVTLSKLGNVKGVNSGSSGISEKFSSSESAMMFWKIECKKRRWRYENKLIPSKDPQWTVFINISWSDSILQRGQIYTDKLFENNTLSLSALPTVCVSRKVMLYPKEHISIQWIIYKLLISFERIFRHCKCNCPTNNWFYWN